MSSGTFELRTRSRGDTFGDAAVLVVLMLLYEIMFVVVEFLRMRKCRCSEAVVGNWLELEWKISAAAQLVLRADGTLTLECNKEQVILIWQRIG